jgi:hypothetical protein
VIVTKRRRRFSSGAGERRAGNAYPLPSSIRPVNSDCLPAQR